MKKSRFLKIIVPVLVALIVLVVLETGLRLFAYGYDSSYIIQKKTPHGTRAILNPPALLTYTGLGVINSSREPFVSAPLPKPDRMIRVVVLGGSAAYGAFQVPDLSFARYLEAMLRLRFPDHKVEVVNLAFPSLNSSAMKRIIEEAMILQPDFVVYYGAANDLGRGMVVQVSGLTPRFVFFLEEITYTVKRLRLYQLVIDVAGRHIQRFQSWLLPEKWNRSQPLHSLPPAVSQALVAAFRHNLAAIANVCREKDIPLFLCTYAHNRKNPCSAAPFGGGKGPQELYRLFPLLEQAYAAEKTGRYAEAVELYDRIHQAMPKLAAPLAHQAFCCYALGRPDEAAMRYDKSLQLSVGYTEKLQDFNRILVDIAASSARDEILLIDIAAELERSSLFGYLPDEAFFTDIVHFTDTGSYTVARNIYQAMVAYMIGDTAEPHSQARCEQEMGISESRKEDIMNANSRLTFVGLSVMMQRPPMSYALMHDVIKRYRLRSFVEKSGKTAGMASTKTASFLSLPYGPDYYFYKNQAVDLMAAGQSDSARRAAATLVEKTDRHSLALVFYGHLLRRYRQDEHALEFLQEAIAQPPRGCDLGLRMSAAEAALAAGKAKIALKLLDPGWRMMKNRQPVVGMEKNLFAGFQSRYETMRERAQRQQ